MRNRCRTGRLHRLHRGVYAVGHTAPSWERHGMAAVLALCGSPSGFSPVLSHRSAAELWGMLPARDGPVDVALPCRSGRKRRRGIRIHRSATLTPAETTQRRGIPVTTPARTVADLKGAVSGGERRRAIRQAEFLGLSLGHDAEADGTRSELERLFLRLCRRHDVPRPDVNVPIGPLTVDFCWPDRRLVVETDGFKNHGGRQAFEDDHARDLELRGRGYEVLRLTYRQVTEDPRHVAAVLRRALAA